MGAAGEEAGGGAGLASLVRARRDEIVTEWARRARASPAARKLDALALNDFIPALLDRIATALEDSSGADATVDDVAAEHALERLSEGYDVASAAAEFVTLRETVLDLSERLPAVPLTPGEARVLNRAIDEALVASVARFARAHQRTLAALDRVSSAALGSGDVDQFLPRLLAVLLETTAAADVAFVLLRGDDDVLHVRAAAGAGAELAGLAARMGEGFAGTIAGSVEPLTSRDASTDPLVTDPAFRGLGVHALYGVPLVHEGRVMGVAGMGSRSAWELSREDEQLFRTMAQRATSLIVQSGLVASRRKAQEELSRDASSRKRAEERLKRIQDRLRARREVERKLIAIVSHDLRNPLHAILLGAQTLLAEPGLDERTVRSLERIRTSAGRASRLVQDLLDFTSARVGRGIPVTPRAADLQAVARAAVEEAREAFPDRAVRVEASGDAHGEWDSDRLVQVVTNLVVNALKYGCRGTEVTVRVAGAGDAATLEVHNEGEPIPADLQAHLFEPYRRGEQDSGDRTSIGLGLYIAHEIVRAHGGSLAARSSASEGTTFTVRLPRARHP